MTIKSDKPKSEDELFEMFADNISEIVASMTAKLVIAYLQLGYDRDTFLKRIAYAWDLIEGSAEAQKASKQ